MSKLRQFDFISLCLCFGLCSAPRPPAEMDGAGRDVYFLSILALVFGFAYITTRLVIVLRDIYRRRITPGYGKTQRKSSVKTMVVVGSGSLFLSGVTVRVGINALRTQTSSVTFAPDNVEVKIYFPTY